MSWPVANIPNAVVFDEPKERDDRLRNWGRNQGYFTAGLAVQRIKSPPGDYLVLRGVTTRGDTSTAAELLMPVDDIDAVINLLESQK